MEGKGEEEDSFKSLIALWCSGLTVRERSRQVVLEPIGMMAVM